MNVEEIMKSLGWYRETHLLPIDKKCEYRYHREGSEITEEEAKAILEKGVENEKM